MRNLISIVLMSLFLSSCSSLHFKYQSLNTAAQVDALYQATGVQPTVIETTSQAARMFNNDFRFRWNHQTFLNQQPYMWWANYYWDNRMWRFGWQSSWDLYTSWNYGAYTLGWSSWSPHRWSPFGYDRWGYNPWGYSYWNNWGMYGYGYGHNDWYWRNRMNTYAWNNRYRTNTVYVNGRRGSSNINNTISNRRRVNNVSQNNSNTNTIRVRPNNNNVIINNNSRPPRPSINNSRPSNPRGYGRPEINNNNNNNSRPVYTRPSTPPNINRGSNNSTRPSRSSGTRGGNTRK